MLVCWAEVKNRAAKSSRSDPCCRLKKSPMCSQSEFENRSDLQHAELQLVKTDKRRKSNIPPLFFQKMRRRKKKCTYTSHVISWYHFTPDSLLDSLRPTRTTVSTVSRQQGSNQRRLRTEGRARFECEDWPPGTGSGFCLFIYFCP